VDGCACVVNEEKADGHEGSRQCDQRPAKGKCMAINTSLILVNFAKKDGILVIDV